MRYLGHWDSYPREICKDETNVQLAKNTPFLGFLKRNTQQSLNQGGKITTHGRKDKVVHRRFTYDCTIFLKSGAYLYTVELEDVSNRDPIIGSSTKEFIHLNLMIWKNARETIRNGSLFKTRAKLPNPSRDLEEGEFYYWET